MTERDEDIAFFERRAKFAPAPEAKPTTEEWPACSSCHEPLPGDGEPCFTCKPCSECDAVEGHAPGCSERELDKMEARHG